MTVLSVGEAVKVINQLQRENAELLEMLTRLHRDAFKVVTAPDYDDSDFLTLMGTMSEVRTTIRHAGGTV